MNTSTCSLPSLSSSLCALSAPRQVTPPPEVQLRTHCRVEYTVQARVQNRVGGEPGEAEEPEVVLLSIFVPRCSLNPNQVRIVEV